MFNPDLRLIILALYWVTFGVLYGDAVLPLLDHYCVECHNEKKRKGQIRLDDLTDLNHGNPHLWTKVYEKIVSGEMPPEDEEQFTADEKKKLLGWLVSRFEDESSKKKGPGRKLNRRELTAALQDLTGVSVDYGAGLAEDGRVEGFDTGIEGLKDTAETVGQMLEVTRRAVESLRFLEPAREKVLEADFREHEFTDFRKWVDQRYKEDGFFTKSKRLTCRKEVGIYLPTEWSGDRGNSFLAVPVPADKNATVLVKLRVKAKRPMPGLPLPILWVKIGGKYIDYVPMSAEARNLEYALRVEDCLVEDGVIKMMLRSVVEMPYAVEGFENDDRSKPGDVPGGIGVYRPKYDRKKLRLPEEQPVPATVVEAIEIDYDHCAQWPPETWGFEAEISDSEGSAKLLLSWWMERAWRCPVTGAEVGKYLELYSKLRNEGLVFDAALRAAFQSVLMSPGFRYHSPMGDGGGYALASRLSFMLAGGPPDQELLGLAQAGKLDDTKVVEAQVKRLMSDSEVAAMFRPFVMQWLVMDQPVTLAMSHLQKQDFRFGRHLKWSMKEETVEYLRALFVENRPAKELVSSDWTMMNDILGVHYGVDGMEGAEFRRVDLKKVKMDPRGGGILGHAGIQSMLTWMGDNWVIYRGSWALNHILDDPPPAPPLDVPELNPLEGENRGKTFRDVLKIHLEDERCATCHKDMDPLGFAFQNFDLSGRWRDLEFHHYSRKELDGKIEWRGSGESRPVDSNGRLPNGETFTSYPQFKQLLGEHYDDEIVRGLLKRLTLYGTGRSPNVLDLRVIDGIMTRNRKPGYPMRDLLADLVNSPIFRDHQKL